MIFHVLTAIFITLPTIGLALPINFGRPQEPRKYSEIISKNFHLYHDTKTRHEARGVINSLEATKPTLERWLGTYRTNTMPIIMSSTTTNASFANFLTDAIEIQTGGFGGRDLAWHEQVHATMYNHFNNIFGHAGSIFHLVWMPTWWIEGLAEALSVSAHTAYQIDIERRFAITKKWPSYARLHNLYGNSSFASIGYGISGSFVRYLLDKYDANQLPKILEDFYDYSLPHWWPVAIVPFADTLPMDMALKRWTGKTGPQLWDEYKNYANVYWSSQTTSDDQKLITATHNTPGIYNTKNLYLKNNSVYISVLGDKSWTEKLKFFDLNGNYEKKYRHDLKYDLPNSDKLTNTFALHPSGNYLVTSKVLDSLERTYAIRFNRKSDVLGKKWVQNRGAIANIFVAKNRIYWLEFRDDKSLLCFKSSQKISGKISCPITVSQPRSLKFLGVKKASNYAKEVWLRHTEETFIGSRHKVISIDLATNYVRTIKLQHTTIPISISFSTNNLFLLSESHKDYVIEQIDNHGKCIKAKTLPLQTKRILVDETSIYLASYTGNGYRVIKSSRKNFLGETCKDHGPFLSPLMYASLVKGADLNEAISMTSPRKPLNEDLLKKLTSRLKTAISTDKSQVAASRNMKYGPAKWRGRTQFAFPWLGADAGGLNFGTQSVPLMDEMQNETLQLVALYGLQSSFPTLILNLDSNRYKTYLNTKLYNQQTYNGAAAGSILYYRETGGSVTFRRYFPISDFSIAYGANSAYFQPIIGPENFRIAGQENKFRFSISKSISFRNFSWSHSLGSTIVPQFANKTWDYNKVFASSQISIPITLGSWRLSTLGLGISASGTRGRKRKYLKEEYRPLKTFVPGSGGGLNGVNFPLRGPRALTAAQTGDTKARTKLSWTLPIVPDLEKLIGIVYLQRLDFTAFFNYGGAWNGSGFDKDILITAHGYNLDLQADIKGVNLNVGIGIGQVTGYNYDTYFLFGFDTIVDIDTT